MKFNESLTFKNKYYRYLFILIKKFFNIGTSSKLKKIANNLLFDKKKSELNSEILKDLENYFKSTKIF